MYLVEMIAESYSIPIIATEYKSWFLRTEAGKFYHDYKVNGFIALGWDLISSDLIERNDLSDKGKKEIIAKTYPKEKRPGLILSQLDIFYRKMKKNDFVIIPADGGKEISIGRIGDLLLEVVHKEEPEEYPQCDYVHKRKVTWITSINVGQDIYLLKALRAQQTIADLTECDRLIFRNLFPAYVANDGVHITLQKHTNTDFSMRQNVCIQSNIISILEAVKELYRDDSYDNDISIKTAVGSPGFMELIFPLAPTSLIAVIMLIKVIGKTETEQGTSTGLLAIVSKVNDLINDHYNRKKTEAETKLIEAQVKKTEAETELIQAQTKMTSNQSKNIESGLYPQFEQIEMMLSGETNIEERERREKLHIPTQKEVEKVTSSLETYSESIRRATSISGISVDGKEEKGASVVPK